MGSKGNAATEDSATEVVAVTAELIPVTPAPTQMATFTCQRCGYEYQKNFDHAPFLCHRCLRFLAKGMYTLYNKLQPSTSTPSPTES